jgi:hypothetical protein
MLFGLGCFVAPTMLIWGWIRWIRQPKQRSITSIFSLIGFLLATTSAVAAAASVLYAVVHGLNYVDDWGIRIGPTATWLSLAGIVSGICGVWRPNSLRWHSAISAIGTLAFWVLYAEIQ